MFTVSLDACSYVSVIHFLLQQEEFDENEEASDEDIDELYYDDCLEPEDDKQTTSRYNCAALISSLACCTLTCQLMVGWCGIGNIIIEKSLKNSMWYCANWIAIQMCMLMDYYWQWNDQVNSCGIQMQCSGKSTVRFLDYV